MTNNIFLFNNETYLQLTGTAMGTSPAPTYATHYFWIHKNNTLPHHLNQCLSYYGRYIDDLFGIWDCSHSNWESDWVLFKNQMNSYGSLKWEFSELQTQSVFLDMTVNLNNGHIRTIMYEKDLNLHLYLPASSAHPPGALTSLVTGMLTRINTICSEENDRQRLSKNFLKYLVYRGYSKKQLNIAWRQANKSISSKKTTSPIQLRPVILHTNYFQSTRYKYIKNAYHDLFEFPSKATPISECITNDDFNTFGPAPLTLAHHRSRNLKNILAPRKLLSDPFEKE
ncbi:hypothetical protein ACHAWX_001867 [Stephanocyclus meneghinianus]